MAGKKSWAWINGQSALGAFGPIIVLVGATLDRDRPNLAVTLAGLGGLLIVLAVLLPRLESFRAKLPGIGEIPASLTPAAASVSDRPLAPAGRSDLIREFRRIDTYVRTSGATIRLLGLLHTRFRCQAASPLFNRLS